MIADLNSSTANSAQASTGGSAGTANQILLRVLWTTLLVVSVVTFLVLGLTMLLSVKTVSASTLILAAVLVPLLLTPPVAFTFSRLSARLDEAEQTIHKLGYTDALTGLYKRQYLFEVGYKELLAAARYDYPVSLLLIDIDGFKAVNDEHGHLVGDHTLRNTAKVIQESLRETDFFARYGGEEFAVLMPHATWEQAEVVSERVRVALENLRTLSGGKDVLVTVSIGLSNINAETKDLAELLQQAERALLHAKSLGGNHVAVAEALAKAEVRV